MKQRLQYTKSNQRLTSTTRPNKQQLNGFVGDATAYLENFSSPFDASGNSINKTTQTRTTNRTTKTVISSTTLPTSTQPSIQTTINGQLISSVSPSHGGTTLYQYDALGRQTGQKQPRHTNYSTITYNAIGQLASTTDATGATTTYVYYANGVPGAGQLRQQINALGHSTFHEYDLQGRETYTWGPATYPVVQGYDVYGQRNLLRTFRDTNADFSTSLFPTAATGDTTTWNYDDATGVLLQKTYADGKGPTYTYYADGLLKTRTWARKDTNNNPLTTTYTYTPQGPLSFIDYNDPTPDVTYTYNPLGQQTTITDGSGTRNFTYDPATQALTQEIYSGLLNATLNRAYDAYTRPTGYALADSTGTAITTAAQYTYDPQGNFSQVPSDTIPNQLTTSLSAANTTNLTPNTFTYNRLANSDLISTVTGPVHTVSNTYEPNRNVLTSKQNRVTIGSNANNIISQYDYTINALGQRITRTQTGTAFDGIGYAPGTQLPPTMTGTPGSGTTTDNFTYNPRGEVINSINNIQNALARSYTYDPIGNRLNATEGDLNNQSTSSNAKTYTSNSLNQYTQINTTLPTPPTTAQPTYDDGNLLTDGTGKTYTWDSENRLTQVTLPDNEVVKYYYDSGGRRIKRDHITANSTKSTIYFYDSWNVIEKQTVSSDMQSSVLQNCTWGLDLSGKLHEAGGIGGLIVSKTKISGVVSNYFFAYDGNGNVSELIDHQDFIQAHYTYDVFGGEMESIGIYSAKNLFRFSTKSFDEGVRTYYFGYRYYDSNFGRWNNRDPFAEQGGFNLYSAMANGMVNYWDSHGLKTGGGNEDGEKKKCCLSNESIVIKRNHIKLDKKNEIQYGHWWIEIDGESGESYGWWPIKEVDYWKTVRGVPGGINRCLKYDPSKCNRDPHHGEKPDQDFKPKIKCPCVLQSGGAKGKSTLDVKMEDIKDCIRKFVEEFAKSHSKWAYPFGENCHSFQNKLMKACCLEEPQIATSKAESINSLNWR